MCVSNKRARNCPWQAKEPNREIRNGCDRKGPAGVRLGPWEADRRVVDLVFGLLRGVRVKAIISEPSTGLESGLAGHTELTQPQY